MDCLRKTEVSATISWNQALNAIEDMLKDPDRSRFSVDDGSRLLNAAIAIFELLQFPVTVGVTDTIHTCST